MAKNKLISNDDKNFLKKLLMKTLSMFGFTYFSVAVTTQAWTLITPSLLASGLYASTEMMKYYKLQPNAKVKKGYNFLI